MRRLPALLVAALAVALAVPSLAGAVVGGRDAGSFPAMAALYVDGDFLCGATLIAPDVVLTAAHCVRRGAEPVAADEVKLVLGRQDLRDTASGEEIGAAQVTVHEGYGEPASGSNDVALVRLTRATTRQPMALLPPDQRERWSAGRQATVLGWGTNAPILGMATSRLKQTSVPMVSDRSCAGSYGREFDPRSMVCAGRLLGDACQGDSGGPLMVPDASGRLAQVGVVSFGFACGLPGSPGVYARVADTPLYGWITARVPAARGATAPAEQGAPNAVLRAPKLGIRRAEVERSNRILDVLAPITARASGEAEVQFRAAGRRERVEAAVDAGNRRIRLRERIPAAQARLGTGILTIAYPGDADTRPQELRLRAAAGRARLVSGRPTLRDGRLRARGTLNRRASGVVRVAISYVHAGQTVSLERRARIEDDGDWSLAVRLPAEDLARIAARTGTVHSTVAFTGDFEQRIRGEARSFQVLPAP